MLRKLICTTALLLWGVVTAHAAPVLSVTPPLNNVIVGNMVTLDIRIDGVTDLFAWEMDLGFTPTGKINASAATEGSFLGAGTTFGPGTVNNLLGSITFMFNALSGATGITGNGILASVSFLAVMAGTVTVSLSNVILYDSNLDQIFFNAPSDIRAATIIVADAGGGNMPEPSTLLLLGLALACFAIARRRVS